jgi:hypothetical protein
MAVEEDEEARQVAGMHERVEDEPVPHERPEGRREVLTDEPVVVRDVLHHRAQADEERVGGKPRDRLRGVGGGKLRPAHDARHEGRPAGGVEHEGGLGLRRGGLDQDGPADAVPVEERPQVLGAVVPVEHRQVRIHPGIVAPRDLPDVLVRVDSGLRSTQGALRRHRAPARS